MKNRPRMAGAALFFALSIAMTAGATGAAGAADGPVDLVQATTEVPEERLLDAGIEVFAPGTFEPSATEAELEEEGIFADVRRSEARYLAFHLKDTLQSTGFWGAVRVVPAGTDALELRVSGTIVHSDGRRLVVDLRAEDAAGRRWLDRRYKAIADPQAYAPDGVAAPDPYQDLYDEIANDLQQRWQRTDDEEILEIRQIAELQFAASLAPDVFGDYLEEKRRGRIDVARLPAEDDPMMARVASIRERDYMFIDTLNEYYANFYRRMEQPYDEWRSFSYDEQMALRAIRREARLRTLIGALAIVGGVMAGDSAGDIAIIGGAYALESGLAKGREKRIHVESLRELAASFEAEIEPVLVEVEGETVRLSGAAEAQFEEWRELLRRIFEEETGLPRDPNRSVVTGEVGR